MINKEIIKIYENNNKGVLKIKFDKYLSIFIDLENKNRIELHYTYNICLIEVTEINKELFYQIIKENKLIFDNKEYNILNYEFEN